MSYSKLLRITTVPISLHKLLQGQFAYMQQNGFEVVLASAKGSETKQIEQETGLKVHVLPLTRKIAPFTDLKAIWKTYQLIKKEKPDIVHTHTPKAGLIGMLAAKLAGVPIRMHTIAGLPLMEASGFKRKILNWVEKITAWAATGVYPNSFAIKEFMIQQKLVPANKLKVIANGSSNGIDTAYFSKEHFLPDAQKKLREQLRISNMDIVYTFIGRLVKDKGINELINAFIKLQKEVPQAKLLLVGNEEPELDPLLPETQKEIKNNSNILTTGWVEDVRPYLSISHVFVFPSYREGMPNVVLQAGAMELPQIVTDINGSNEIITNNKNGLIIPVKDEQALYGAMQKLSNEELQKELSNNARSIIKEKYEQQIVWQALLEEYINLLK